MSYKDFGNLGAGNRYELHFSDSERTVTVCLNDKVRLVEVLEGVKNFLQGVGFGFALGDELVIYNEEEDTTRDFGNK